ncbi:MAG: hypothetical protein JNL21_20145 [Myxococcales bacterium]|nr:hypothetical protein [Myxococcales bacterium]
MARSRALGYDCRVTQAEPSPPSQASTRELGLRVQAAFSVGEIRRLLEAWGATPEELDGDGGMLAHRLASLGMKRFGIGEMTRRLRTEKPLIEWPDEDAGSERWAGRRAAIDPEQTLVDAAPEGAKAVPPTLPDLDLALPETTEPGDEPRPPPAEATESAAPAPPVASERVAPPPPSKNPMIFLEPEAMRAKPEGGAGLRTLALGGVGLIVLTALAFGAGLAWNRGSPGAQAATAPEEPGSVLAQRAAAGLDERLRSVASLCELEVTGQPSREVLGVAQELCGQDDAKAPRRRSRRPELDVEPRPPRDEPVDLRPTRPRPTPVASPEPPREQPTGRGSCTKACMRVQEECVAACGPEPSNASLYDGYLACSGKCITASSRCRTSCP